MQARAFDASVQLTLRPRKAEIISYVIASLYDFSAQLQIFHIKIGKAASVSHESKNKFALLALVLCKH